MKVLLLGAGGQLASDLVPALAGHAMTPLTHADVDVCDAGAVDAAISGIRPDTVINTAAYHRVDDCEDRYEQAFSVNVVGVINVARACAGVGATLLHMSTDYVFDGTKGAPYLEEDRALPVNLYGLSKLAGEMALRQMLERHYIVRGSGLFGRAGASGKGGNFINTMLRLARQSAPIRVVDDQRFSPTSTVDLARKIVWLLGTGCYGTYHITNQGDCTWYEFAAEIFRQANVRADLSATTSEAFGARAHRPAYSVLGHGALQAMHADDLRPWQEALDEYLRGAAGTHGG